MLMQTKIDCLNENDIYDVHIDEFQQMFKAVKSGYSIGTLLTNCFVVRELENPSKSQHSTKSFRIIYHVTILVTHVITFSVLYTVQRAFEAHP